MREAATGLRIRVAAAIIAILFAFCLLLPCIAFAEDSSTELKERHVWFLHSYTECTGEEHPLSDEELAYKADEGRLYPDVFSITMMKCDTDHIVKAVGDGVTDENTMLTSMTPSVLEIDSEGNVVLKKTGTAQIKATVEADEEYAERSVYLFIKIDMHTGLIDGTTIHYADRPAAWGLDLDINDGPHQIVLQLRQGAGVTYSAEDPSVISVDANGVVTPVSNGITQIWFDIDDGGGRYKAYRFGMTVKITGEDMRSRQEITGGLGPFTVDWHDGLQLSLQANTDITYSLVSGDNATVDENGFVSFGGTGQAIVKAVAAESEEYHSAEATITITARDYAAEAAAAQKAAEEAAAQKAAEEAAAQKAAEEAAAQKAAEEAAQKAAEEAAQKAAEAEAANKGSAEETAKTTEKEPSKTTEAETAEKTGTKKTVKKIIAKKTTKKDSKRAFLKEQIKKAKSLKKPSLKVKALKGKKIKITWSKVKNADGYILYVKYPGSKKYVKAVTRKATIKSVTHKGLSKGKVYRYKVRAYKRVNGKKYYSSFSKVKKAKAR